MIDAPDLLIVLYCAERIICNEVVSFTAPEKAGTSGMQTITCELLLVTPTSKHQDDRHFHRYLSLRNLEIMTYSKGLALNFCPLLAAERILWVSAAAIWFKIGPSVNVLEILIVSV
jgi:hypothetical protein